MRCYTNVSKSLRRVLLGSAYKKTDKVLTTTAAAALCLFVAASHQTGLDKSPKAIKVGIKEGKGRERAETRTLRVYAAHRLTWYNVSLMRQAVSRTQMWVRARMPGYGLNYTARSNAIHRFRESPRYLGSCSLLYRLSS